MQNHRKNEKLRKFAISATRLGEDKQNQTADLLNAMRNWLESKVSKLSKSSK